jgi:hypothetical protein
VTRLKPGERNRLLYRAFDEHLPRPRTGTSTPKRLNLAATDAVDGSLFNDAYASALAVGFTEIELSFAPGAMLDRSVFNVGDEHVSFLEFVVGKQALEVRSFPAEKDTPPKAANAPRQSATAFSVPTRNDLSTTKFADLLSRVCSTFDGCERRLVLVANDADVGALKRALPLISSTATPAGKSVLLKLEPGPDGPRTRVSGRLPPGEIQRIVRENFGAFRICYESGLKKNAKLEGRVMARFVIGRDGTVTKVTDEGSTLPDPDVVACVLKAFNQLKFPKPEGGIVTVVYPIMLAPG